MFHHILLIINKLKSGESVKADLMKNFAVVLTLQMKYISVFRGISFNVIGSFFKGNVTAH